VYQPILSLRGSRLHHTNIELYRRHHDIGDGSGRCAACGDQYPCQVAKHAAQAILVAGEDPRWYDGELPTSQLPTAAVRQPKQAPVNANVTVVTLATPVTAPVYAGYPVGDNSLRANIACETYER
jgi:hypothetical protein